MQIHKGDMWLEAYDSAGLFLITTNGTITNKGKLVMGRGIAAQALQRFPKLDVALANEVKTYPYISEKRAFRYGFFPSPRWPLAKLAPFQVKYQWSDKATLDLIALSVIQLRNWMYYNPDVEVHVNFPGIGNGRLDSKDVLPYIEQVEGNFNVWQMK